MTIYEGEWNEKVYAVAGDVLDGVSIVILDYENQMYNTNNFSLVSIRFAHEFAGGERNQQ